MSRPCTDIAFTPAVRAEQTRLGSRSRYEAFDHTPDRRDRLTDREADFIAARDGFYQATVSETGWPRVQFRGGPPGLPEAAGHADAGLCRLPRQRAVRQRR